MNTLFGSWRRLVEHRSGPTTLIATLFAGLLLTGCPDFLTSEDDGRILPLKSIDGVRLGDSREQVEMRLGEPDAVAMGDFPGVLLEYTSGSHAGMDVTVYTGTGEGIAFISVKQPYDGRTEGGLGLGSSREAFLRELGRPSSTHNGDNTISDYYREADATFFITSNADDKLVDKIAFRRPPKQAD